MLILEALYKLIHSGIRIWLENAELNLFVPEELSLSLQEEAFLKENVEQIIKCLEENKIFSSVDSLTILKTGMKQATLSYSQSRMRFIEQYIGGSDAYNIPTLTYELAIREAWQEEALKRSLEKIVERHEVLRTLIKEDEAGEGYQEVEDLTTKPLFIVQKDLENEAVLREQLREDAHHIYQLDKEYPIRIGLYRVISSEKKYLSVVVHHIAFDGWSIEIFLRELNIWYTYYAKEYFGEQGESLPDLPIQYKDFAYWQRIWLSGDRLERELVYWRKELLGKESLNFPIDKPRPKEIDYRGAKEFFELSEGVSEGLRRVARELGVSLYSLLLAGYCLALKGYSGQEEIVVGTPVSNRHHEGVKDVIGLFVNMLALRIEVYSLSGLVQYIKAVGEKVVQAQLHQDLPFDKLVEELALEKDTSRHPIFQVVFALENFASSLMQEEAESYRDSFDLKQILRGYYQEDVYKIAKFDLSLFIDDSAVKLRGNAEYAISLFEVGTIKCFVKSYLFILEQLAGLAGDGDKLSHMKVGEIAYLEESEKQRIVYGWNRTEEEFIEEETVVGLFEKRVEERPDSIAVVYGEKHLSYRELNARANQLAAYLLLNGVVPENTVAILLEKSIDTIIAIVSVIKLGAAYVPIDLSYPKDRVNYILVDSKAKILLTQENLAENYEDFKGKVVSIDPLKYQIYSASNLCINILPQSLAYVIYTSGSTGKPKGVLTHYAGLFNTLMAVNKKFDIGINDAALVLSNLTFDLSVYDILGLLIVGGKVVVPRDTKDPEYWSRIVKQQRISIWNTVPQLAKLWSYHEDLFPARTHLNKIRLFLLSGDTIPRKLPRALKKITGLNSVVMSLGGATEASIWSIWHETEGSCSIPYGKPMPNQQMYILDNYLNPVPINVSGEIYIGGIGLARGYLGRPDLTAEKFVANPFTKGRLYRTGDRGKFSSEGNIIFLGREDNQVKIRGYRVELGEIDALLTSMEAVKQSITLAYEENNGQKVLLAYVVLSTTANANYTQDLLREKCQAVLPEYMQPYDIIIIDQLPITANGKIDRNELLSHHQKVPIKEELEIPLQGHEKILANIWCALLKLEKVDRKSNFFRLGGDSILSIQMVSKARKEGILIDIRQIFNTPTIVDLAKHCKVIEDDRGQPEEGEFELLPIQQWFFDYSVNVHHFNQAFWFITDQDIDFLKLEEAIHRVRSSHGVFRLKFKKSAGKHVQYYAQKTSTLSLKVENKVLNEEQLIAEINKIHQSLNIITGPIDRVIWFNGYGLLWIIHHLIVDGVSWRILLEELNSAYAEEKLLPKSNNYKEWSNYIASYQKLDKVCDFYSQNSTQLLCHQEKKNEYISEILLEFSQELTRQFIGEANKCYDTLPNDLLLTALKLAIGDVTENYGVTIDVEGHGRDGLESQLDLSSTVGWFTIIYPITFSITNPYNLTSTIREVKKYLRAIPHKGVSHGIVVQKGKIKPPNSSIIFNYLGQLDSTQANAVFNFGNYPIGNVCDKKNKANYTIEINGAVKNNILFFEWKYTDTLSDDIVNKIVLRFKERFIEVVQHCTQLENYSHNINSFDAELEEEDLAYITDLVSKL